MCSVLLSQARENPKAAEWLKRRDLSFQENKGQILDVRGNTRPDILFTSEVNGAKVYFRGEAVSYVFAKVEKDLRTQEPAITGLHRMDLEFVGANRNVNVIGELPSGGVTHYYTAASPAGVTNVKSYSKITYRNLYDNIDLVFYPASNNGQTGMKYDFVVRPGGKVSDIQLRYAGADRASLNADGTITATTPLGSIGEGAPYTYMHGSNQVVASQYLLRNGVVSFRVGNYNANETLVIDPFTTVASTYYGSIELDQAFGVAVGSNGNTTITGYTQGAAFPVTTGQTTFAGANDAFIVQFNAQGQRVWASYYGGASIDQATGVAVDAQNNVIIAGVSASSAAIATNGTAQSTFGGGSDAFVAKFNSSGLRQWGTYYGGSAVDRANGVAVDANGDIYAVGHTYSDNFNATTGQTVKGTERDAFILKLSGANGGLTWATLLGGNGTDIANAVAVSGQNVIAAGQTASSNNIGSIGSFAGGTSDAFVASFNAGSGSRNWGAYWGGTGNDIARAVAVAADGSIFVGGSTTSSGLATSGAHQTTIGGAEDGFVGRLSSAGQAQAATYFGGSDLDRVSGIAVNANGVFITGHTYSSNFPVTPSPWTNNAASGSLQGGSDAFLAQLTSNLTLNSSGFFGGRSVDVAHAIALGSNNLVVFAGQTISRTDFPTLNPAQATNAGNDDAFVVWATAGGTNPNPCTGFSASAFANGSTISVTVNGGTAPYTYTLLPNGPTQSSDTFPGVGDGSYTVRVTDSSNPLCTTTSNSVTVGGTNPCANFNVSATSSDATSGNNGSITVNVSGGNAPYTYTLRPNGTVNNTGSFPNLAAGSYSVEVRDNSNPACTGVRDVIVNQGGTFPYLIRELNNDANALIVCEDGSVTLVVANPQGQTFQWFRNGVVVPGATGDRIVIRNPVFGTDRSPVVAQYSVTGPNGQSNSLTVVFNPNPINTYASGSEGVICSGAGTARVCAQPQANVVYTWFGPNFDVRGPFTDNCFEVPGPGTWYALLTNTITGCKELTVPVNFIVVDGPARPSITPAGSTNLCAGQSVQLSTVPQAGILFQWRMNGENIVGATGTSFFANVSGIFDVVARSASTGCTTISNPVAVTISQAPAANLTAGGITSFCRESDVNVVLTAPSGLNNTYTWRRNGVDFETSGSNTIIARQSGVWDVIVRNPVGCSTVSNPISITVNELPTPTILTGNQRLNYCIGEGISVLLTSSIAAPGLTYTWTQDNMPLPNPNNSPSIVVNQAGNYRLSITDLSGNCTSAAATAVTITSNPIPDNSFVITDRGPGLPGQDFACEGGFIGLQANVAGAQYQWYSEGQAIVGATGRAYNERRVGVWSISLQVTNLGCASSVSASRQLTINPKPHARITTPNNSRNICVGQSLVMNACETGLPDPQNLEYRWILNGTDIPNSNSCTYEARVPGIYQVYIRNFRTGCDSLASVTLQLVEPPVPTVSIVNNAPTTFCEGGSVMLMGNPMADSYRWFRNNVPVEGATMRTFSATETGSYRIELTVGACVVISQPVNVNVTPLPSADITVDGSEEFCSGTDVTLIAQPGADSYQWMMSFTADGVQMPISGANQSTFAVTERGFYTVMVMKDGCSNTTATPVQILVNQSPQAWIQHPGVGNEISRCAGATDVVMTAQPPGRMLSYAWLVGSTPETARVIEGADDASFRPHQYGFHLVPGRYRFWVQVTSPQCSTLSAPVDVVYKPIPAVEVTHIPDSIICQDGAVVLIARGYNANPGATYEFTWFLNGEQLAATGDTLYARESGIYQALVTAELCSGGLSNPINVKVQPNPDVNISITGLEHPCVGATLNVVDEMYLGRPLYRYRWLLNGAVIPGANGSSYTTDTHGNYSVVIVNTITGCEELSQHITIHPNPVADAGPTVSTCEGVPVTLMGSASGGDDQQYFYSWDGPAGLNYSISDMTAAQPDVTINESGTYVFELTVTDGRGCISNPVGLVSVIVNENPVADAGPDAAICQNTAITLTGFAMGGAGVPYNFFWLNESGNIFPGQTTQPITLTEVGMHTFTLVAIDGNGCEGRDMMMVQVNAEPSIIAVDGNPFPNPTATFCFGGNIVLSSTAEGSFYNWYRDGEFVQGGVDNRYTAFIGGDYTVEVFDNNTGISCTSPEAFRVTVNPLPVAVVTPSSGIICPNTPFMLEAGSLPGYSFQWLVGSSPEVAVPAPGDNTGRMYGATMAGTYWVMVTSAEGCTALSAPVNLTMSTLHEVSSTIVQPSACGSSDGSIFVQYSSNVFPVEYSINGAPFQFSGFFGNLSAGMYNVAVREIGGCTVNMDVNLTVAGPRNLVVIPSSITDNSAMVSWTATTGSGRIRYNLRYRVVGAERWEMMFNGINGTSHMLMGLQQDTQYEVEVQTVCVDEGNVASPWSEVIFTTAKTQGVTCETPSDIYVNIETAPNGVPTVYWQNVAGAACYDLQYRTVTPLGSWITLQVVNGNNPFPLVDLLPNTTYEVRMRAYCTFCNSLNFSNFSPNIPFTTPGACDPNFFVSINDGVNEVTNCGDYTLSYDGEIRANYAFQWYVDGVEIGGATMPWFEAQMSGEYDLMLTVGNCDPIFSNRVRVNVFVQPEVIANVQQNVSCLDGADGVIVAGCVDVPRRPCNLNSFGYAYMISGPTNVDFQQSGIFTGLAPGLYTVTIRDLETGCEASYSDPVYTMVSAPEQAKFVAVTGTSASTVSVEWNSVLGSNGYVLSYRPVGSGEQNWTDVPFTGGCPYPGTCNFTLENLQNGTDYEVRVRTRCALGNVLSDWTDTTNATTIALRGCGTASPFDAVPGGIFAIVLDQFTTQVFWNSVPGASCYEVRYRQQGQGEDGWVSTPSTPFTTTTLSGLLANTVYEFEVRSICGSDCSGLAGAWSATRSFRTLFFRGETNVEAGSASFQVYPNPNNGSFTVSFDAEKEGVANIRLFDMTGRMILDVNHTAAAGSNQLPVEVSGYSAGIYLLQLTQGDAKQVVKVVLN